jgi:hypothetical protein
MGGVWEGNEHVRAVVTVHSRDLMAVHVPQGTQLAAVAARIVLGSPVRLLRNLCIPTPPPPVRVRKVSSSRASASDSRPPPGARRRRRRPLRALRILRVFRIIRVFGRVGQLREIVGALTRAIVPGIEALVGTPAPGQAASGSSE